jgi:oxygen-independent coproporphyrinogen-3 oxidase
MKNKAGIYIHVPFCKRRCFYCHFLTLAYDEKSVGPYVDALKKEIRLKSNPGFIVDSIYFGGGSPLLISDRYIFYIMETHHACFSIVSRPEINIECNPEDLTKNKLRAIQEAGFNRLSIGVQSFQNEDLEYLRRNHTVSQSLDSIKTTQDIGINNINVDFIIGLPSQTIKSISGNFSYLSTFDIPHVSCYLLEQVPRENVSEDMEQKLYDFSRTWLKDHDYLHVEVSNFCKTGYECRHNLKYWENQNYLGFGLSASGYEDGVDYKNVRSMDRYIRLLNINKLPIGTKKKINPATRKIVVGLRLLKGISLSSFNHRENELDMLISNHFLVKKRNNIAVNPEKILLLNEILSYFI